MSEADIHGKKEKFNIFFSNNNGKEEFTVKQTFT